MKQLEQIFDDICITREVPHIQVRLVNYIHYDYLDYDVIECLYNKNKRRHHNISLHISKWLKDEIKTPKGKHQIFNNKLFILNIKDMILSYCRTQVLIQLVKIKV